MALFRAEVIDYSKFMIVWWEKGASLEDFPGAALSMVFNGWSAFTTNQCVDVTVHGSTVTFLISVE